MTSIEHIKSIYSELIGRDIHKQCTITDCIKIPSIILSSKYNSGFLFFYFICEECFNEVDS